MWLKMINYVKKTGKFHLKQGRKLTLKNRVGKNIQFSGTLYNPGPLGPYVSLGGPLEVPGGLREVWGP